MGRKGLNKQRVIEAAARVIEKKDFAQLTVLDLAEELGIKSASIYNYYNNLEEIEQDLGLYAVRGLAEVLHQAIEGLNRDRAILAMSEAYVQFARKNPGLYKAFIASHLVRKQETEKSIQDIVRYMFEALATYDLTEAQCVHWGRILRSLLHGFAALEGAGWFSHLPIPLDESFAMSLQSIIVSVEAMERTNRLEGRTCCKELPQRFVPILNSDAE